MDMELNIIVTPIMGRRHGKPSELLRHICLQIQCFTEKGVRLKLIQLLNHLTYLMCSICDRTLYIHGVFYRSNDFYKRSTLSRFSKFDNKNNSCHLTTKKFNSHMKNV